MRFVSLSLAVALVAASVSAQRVVHESLTDTKLWTRTSPTGSTWKDGIAESRSLFKKVDHLVSATEFSYTRTPILLDPGTYVAVARFAKIKAATGAAAIDFKVITTGPTTLVTPAADQKVDSFIHTKALLFTIKGTNKVPTIFFLENKDTKVTKTDYLFDSFHLGKVPGGQAVHVESLTRRWGHSWGAPHYCKEHEDTTASFGFVERLNMPGTSNCGSGSANLWWFRWWSSPKSFLPGTYTGNMRIKKVVSAAGSHNFWWLVQRSTDNGTTWTKIAEVLWDKSEHTVNKWVYTPNLSIDVTNPSHLYRWRLDYFTGPGNSFKGNYFFDSFEVRKGEYTPVGKSCMNNGQAHMRGNIPQLGYPFDMEVGPLGSNTNPVNMFLGVTNPNFDLSRVGWPGCTQYAALQVMVPMPINLGFARLSTTLPTTPTLIGVPWFTSAWQATATGLATTNGVAGRVMN